MSLFSEKRRTALRALLRLLRIEQRRRLTIQKHYNWLLHARKSQLLPSGDWKIWLILAGRGFGKTRTGAETIRQWVTSGNYRRIALIAQTITEAREVMVEGESGLLSISPPWEGVIYEMHKRHLLWKNGAIATLYGAENPEQLRGPQFDGAWIDEFAKFPNPEETLNQLFLSLRLGGAPRALITTTPRPSMILKRLLERKDIVITRGSTFENKENLPESFLTLVKNQFEGTQLGDQELYGEIVENTDTLWTPALLERQRLVKAPDLAHVVIGVDPALSHHTTSDETGIVVAGQDTQGIVYVLADYSTKAAPEEWMRRIGEIYHAFHAEQVVLETNAGGDLLPALFANIAPHLSLKLVRAYKSKWTRAEPIALLYRQHRVFHVGSFDLLEHQMLTYTPQATHSPDRMDALVWALETLCLNNIPQKMNIWSL
ncbi:MAG: terminase family protein [Holosporales bacterium]|jgi:phage terminase large subunit-like protein|nr:terminase family protein [Holosporales bacterium]